MRMVDLITKKKRGEALTTDEIKWMVEGYVKNEIPDYQMSSFFMAVCFRGMTKEETVAMTEAFTYSGEIVDLSAIKGVKVDKHSTGGVGDKTTIVIAPLVASLGAKVAKMSGRGLGHTGGTVDKFDSIPGFMTGLSKERFFEVVNEVGACVIGQTGNLAPADKKCYALRDVTGTVDSIPLIAVSIMSKKLAAGADSILLDVTTGSGAFMKTVDDAIELARQMVDIGEGHGKRTAALITDMDIPLGHNIGNTLEISEAVEVLNGEGPEDLRTVCIELAANMLYLAFAGDIKEWRQKAAENLDNKEALKVLAKMVKCQGGDERYILDTSLFEKAKVQHEVKALSDGYIYQMDTEGIGISSTMLGAGRVTKDDIIDYSAGITLKKKTGDKVNKGDVIAVLHTSKEELVIEAEKRYLESIEIREESPAKTPLIYARVTKEGIEKYE